MTTGKMQITPYSKNAKKHPQKQVEQIANSIKRFGMNQPIVVDKDGVIIVGHGRYEAIKHLGLDLKPEWVVKKEDLTPEEVNAYRLADNKLNESDWDMELVTEELKGLDEELLELTGFDKDLIIEPDEKDDEVPDVPEEPQSKLGDLYELGNHRVLCGDSTKMEDVERLMDGKKADMVFTDPPYGIDYQDLAHKHDKIAGDASLDNVESLLVTTLLNNCPMYICCNWKCFSAFEKAMKDAEREPKSCIVWDKETRIQNLDKYYKQHEFILYHGLFGGQKTITGDVWRMRRQVRGDHPTAKPVELVANAITYTVMPNQTVQDLFLGSGSTLIAAEKTGRICYGMELDPKYVDVIVQRYVDYTGNSTVKKNGEEIVWQPKKQENQ